MKTNLPPEIISVYLLLSEEEKQYLLEKSNLQNDSKLDEIEKSLLVLYSKQEKSSNALSFLLGRILYHRGKLNKICELHTKKQDPGLGLWCALNHIFAGEKRIFKQKVDRLKVELKDTIFYAFIYYILAVESYLIQDYEYYKHNRENSYNYYAINDKVHSDSTRDTFKLIQIYMLELDSIYLQNTYILSLARDKTKESLNINKAFNDRINLAQTYNTIGIIELERGNFQLAHQLFLKGEAIAKDVKIDRLLGHITGSIGDVYLQMGHLEEAMFWYAKSYKEVKSWMNDYRSLYVCYSNFAEVYFAQEEFEKAKNEMEKVLTILDERNFKDLSMQMKYVEILLYLDDLKQSEILLKQIDEESKSLLTPSQKSLYLFLLGFFEYKQNNYGNAQDFLQKSMIMADELGNEILSSKTLVLLTIVFLKKYTITMSLEELIEADKCLDDIITYLEEKAKYESLSIIFYIRSKIKIVLLDFETALFLLKKGEEYARNYTPKLIKNYNARIVQVKEAIDSQVDKIQDDSVVDFIDDIKPISTILRKESKKLAAPKEEKPIAVLILHSSGIPIRTYLSEDVTVSDDLLFGGFVSAIRHLMNELFVEQKQGVLSIDHGQYKLLIEFYSNIFSVVVIALRDSFMLRRKMHRLVENLSFKGLSGDKYRGDISETETYELDSVVQNLFGIKGIRP
ncbi:MAG: tetratricopeptide repeat protein [Candidatus Heimdallarchaeota archaeon]|nr:tetratricopeptide repeat protein [Candidatus Heimdallarchaeota archaeon]